MTMFKRVFSLAALLVFPFVATTQAATSPEQLATEYMAALKKDGMTVVANYIHPDELTRFKQMLLPVFRREATSEEHPLTEGLFGKGTQLTQIEAMSAADFMTALMRVVGEKLEGVKFNDVQVLGSVREDDVVHIVARVSAEASGIKVRAMEAISAKPLGKDWKLLLTGELEGLASALAGQ